MTPKPLNVLKKGLGKITQALKVRRDELNAKLARNIEALLNPAGESHILTETSDLEIYQAVIDSIHARENIEINGGDDVDDDGPVEPHPTRREVLKAVSTIRKYTNNLNDPFVRNIEALLGSFTRQLRLEETRHMKNAVLTDFFE